MKPPGSPFLHSLSAGRTGRVDRDGNAVTEESAGTLQVGQEVWPEVRGEPATYLIAGEDVIVVDETPTKHWTTVVVLLDGVSAECRCGWAEESDESRTIPTQIEQASAAARNHVRDPDS